MMRRKVRMRMRRWVVSLKQMWRALTLPESLGTKNNTEADRAGKWLHTGFLSNINKRSVFIYFPKSCFFLCALQSNWCWLIHFKNDFYLFLANELINSEYLDSYLGPCVFYFFIFVLTGIFLTSVHVVDLRRFQVVFSRGLTPDTERLACLLSIIYWDIWITHYR